MSVSETMLYIDTHIFRRILGESRETANIWTNRAPPPTNTAKSCYNLVGVYVEQRKKDENILEKSCNKKMINILKKNERKKCVDSASLKDS